MYRPGVHILFSILLIMSSLFAGCITQEEPDEALSPSDDMVTIDAEIIGPESVYAGTLVRYTGQVRGDASNSPLRLVVRQAVGETPGLTEYVSVNDGQFSGVINTTGYAEGLYFVHLEHPTRELFTASFFITRPSITLVLNGGRDEMIRGEELRVFGMVTRDAEEVKLRVSEAPGGQIIRSYDLPVVDGVYQKIIETRDFSPGKYLITVSVSDGSVFRPLTVQADTSVILFSSVPESLVQGETLYISGTVGGVSESARLELIRLSDRYISINRNLDVTDGRFSAALGTGGLMPGDYLARATLQNGASDEAGFEILAP